MVKGHLSVKVTLCAEAGSSHHPFLATPSAHPSIVHPPAPRPPPTSPVRASTPSAVTHSLGWCPPASGLSQWVSQSQPSGAHRWGKVGLFSPQALAAVGVGGSWGKLLHCAVCEVLVWRLPALTETLTTPCGQGSPHVMAKPGWELCAPRIPLRLAESPCLVLLRSALLCRWLLPPQPPGPTRPSALSKSAQLRPHRFALYGRLQLQSASQGRLKSAQQRW